MAFTDPGTAASAEELLQRNREAAKVHRPEPLLEERRAAGSPRPRTFIFCCFDPRVDPTTFLGIKPWGEAPFLTVLSICAGDAADVSNNNIPDTSSSGVALWLQWLTQGIDALVVRNGGGAVGPQLQILLAMDHFLGSLEDVFVIQHTDCDALHMTEDGIKGYLKERHLGDDEQIDKLQFGVGNKLEQRVRDNVKLIQDSPFVREELKARTKGLIYDIKTGVLTELQ